MNKALLNLSNNELTIDSREAVSYTHLSSNKSDKYNYGEISSTG